jgi:hypothetical protein
MDQDYNFPEKSKNQFFLENFPSSISPLNNNNNNNPINQFFQNEKIHFSS